MVTGDEKNAEWRRMRANTLPFSQNHKQKTLDESVCCRRIRLTCLYIALNLLSYTINLVMLRRTRLSPKSQGKETSSKKKKEKNKAGVVFDLNVVVYTFQAPVNQGGVSRSSFIDTLIDDDEKRDYWTRRIGEKKLVVVRFSSVHSETRRFEGDKNSWWSEGSG